MKKLYMPDDLARDLSAMYQPKRKGRTLGRPRTRAEIRATRGVGRKDEQGASGSGGIASPLTEESRITQNRTIADPFDPAYVITVAEAASITLNDANGNEVVIEFELSP